MFLALARSLFAREAFGFLTGLAGVFLEATPAFFLPLALGFLACLTGSFLLASPRFIFETLALGFLSGKPGLFGNALALELDALPLGIELAACLLFEQRATLGLGPGLGLGFLL